MYREADMYKPVKDFFTGLGYAVNGEVLGIDVCMQKDGVLTVIELKKSLNLKLLCQAVDRQSVTSQVYIAVPRPKYPKGRENTLVRRIVSRLELGLIYINMERRSPSASLVEIVHFPPAQLKTPSKKRKEQLDKELAGRRVDLNKGGQTGIAVATAYRERALRILCALERGGSQSVKELRRDYGCKEDTSGILTKNFYGWFDRQPGAGREKIYCLSPAGRKLLDEASAGGEFAELVDIYREEVMACITGK